MSVNFKLFLNTSAVLLSLCNASVYAAAAAEGGPEESRYVKGFMEIFDKSYMQPREVAGIVQDFRHGDQLGQEGLEGMGFTAAQKARASASFRLTDDQRLAGEAEVIEKLHAIKDSDVDQARKDRAEAILKIMQSHIAS